MIVYEETNETLLTLLERAAREGSIRIQRPNGQVFVLQPETPSKSPFDLPGIGVNIDLNAEQIVEFVREGRREQT